MRKSTSPLLPLLKIALLISLLILLTIGISACNRTGESTSNTNTAAGTIVSGTAMPATRTCGTIRVQLQGNTSNTQVAGDCFWHAYQQCQANSLIVNFTSIDTITQRTFTIKPSSLSNNATCHITDVVQRSIVPHPAKMVGSYDCVNMNNTQQSLTISACGTDGNIIIPLK